MDWRRVFFRCTILRHFLARPRGVLSETYRYEEISLFPKDLNENYHPSDFAEKVVDPKSFRNILTSTLGWTVSFVLAFFLVVQLTYSESSVIFPELRAEDVALLVVSEGVSPDHHLVRLVY